MARPISFLSDYGLADEFVGVCHGVIAAIAPEARVIDLGHAIPPGDVAAGAAVLVSALPYVPPGVHLAVVDPGVGGERRGVAVRTAGDDRHLVGPDNGLLWQALERFGGAAEAVEVSRTPVRLEPVSATFHGRDVFAPVAAALADGRALGDLGEPLDPAGLVRLERRSPWIEHDRLVAVVSLVDRFGNVALDLDPAEAVKAGIEPGGRVAVAAAGAGEEAPFVATFADAEPGRLLLHVDSRPRLALAVNSGSAAERLGLSPGDEVELRSLSG